MKETNTQMVADAADSEMAQDLVRKLFDYKDGNLYRRVSKQGVRIGNLAGSVDSGGYWNIGINYKLYKSHRLIFLYHHGYLPKYIDHIDGNPANNNITNLRGATHRENHWNQKKTKSYGGKSTSSEYKGVTWHKPLKKWVSEITIDGKYKYIGIFKSELEAAKSYNHAAVEAFGEFARINKVVE